MRFFTRFCAVLSVLMALTCSSSAATYVVTSTADTDGATCGATCTLRQAINASNANANAGINTISFASPTFDTPQIISLSDSGGELAVNGTVFITGRGARLLSVRRPATATKDFRVFNLANNIFVSLSGMTIAGGRLTATDGQGAGILKGGGGGLRLDGVSVESNSISVSRGAIGGGGLDTFAPTNILNSTFSGNSISSGNANGGGAIRVASGVTLDIVNSTFSDNSSSTFGGAIYSRGALNVNQTTFTLNAGIGGGIFLQAGTLSLNNSIVAGNTALTGPDINGTINSGDYNLIGNPSGTIFSGSPAHNKTGVDPKLGALANNGGQTDTHAPSPDSPAVDAGKSSVSTDQRGKIRPADLPAVANAQGGNGSDIGSVEFDAAQSGPNFLVNTTRDGDDGVCSLGDCTLREAIGAANGNADASAITFDSTVFAAKQTITLTLGSLPDFASDVTVSGPTARGAGVTVKGTSSNSDIIFTTNSGTVTLSALTVTNGYIGIFTRGGATTVQGCTITGHFIGVQLNGGDLAVLNCTLSGNTNSGILNSNNSNNNSNATVTSSTLSGNGSGISNLRGSTTTVSNSIVTDRNLDITDGGFNLIGVDAKLGPLADNGGPTQTFALLAGSPAIDAGSNALIPAGVVTDQRGPGYPRIVGGTVDIGAFELDPPQSGASLVVNQTDDHDDGICGVGDCTLREAINAASGNGAAQNTITFDATVFAGKQTIALSQGLLPLINTDIILTGPTASGAGVTIDAGGNSGIFGVIGGTSTFSNLTLSGGKSGGNGGAIRESGASVLTLNNCTISGNTAINVNGFGGGIFSDATLTLNSCTLSDNTSRNRGGGIYSSGTLTLNSCTLSGNTADNGGGVFISRGTFNSSNTIVAGNTAPTNPDLSGTINSGDYNLIGNSQGAIFGGGNPANNITDVDAQLGPLDDYGGPTDTFALLAGSPALDKGNTTLTRDQRGLARPVRLADDIGAYEVQNRQPTVTGFNRTLLEDGSLAFAATDFSGAYSDPENDALSRVILVTLPANGSLTLGGVAVIAGQSIAPADAANLVYAPAADFNGPDSFSFNGADGFGPAANAATVTITVTAVNDVPSFLVGPNQTALEDAGSQLVTGFAKQISAGAPNENTQELTFNVTNSNSGLFSTPPAINAQGDLIYRTAADANGSALVTVTLGDDGGTDNGGKNISAPQSFVITVTAVDDAPVAVADAYTTDQNVTLTVSAADGVLSNDSDVDSASLTAVLDQTTTRGTLTFNSDGSFSYVPNTNSNGLDSFSYHARDGALDSRSVVVTLTVNAVNQAPVAADQNATTDEDVAKAITLSASDIEGDALSYRIVVPPTHGDLSGSAPDLVYTPNADYNGADSFSFRANDGALNSNIATVNITVAPINDAPVALPDGYTTDDNVTLSVSAADGVLANDGDAEGDSLTAVLDQTVSRGTLTFNSDGSFSYVPERGFTYTTAFSYHANDGARDSATVNVTLGVNATPQNIDFGVSVTPKAPQTNDVLTATPVIADATGVSFSYEWSVGGVVKQDGPEDTFDLSLAGQGDKGDEVSVTVTATRGIDSGSATNAVTIINSAPIAFNAEAATDAAAEVSVPVSGFDADGDALSFKRVSGPDNGTGEFVTGASGATSFVYTARSDFSGLEIIEFIALDSAGRDSAVATIAITVNAISQPINFGVSIVPKAPRTGDTLTATPVIADADATGASYSYAWSVNGVVAQDGPSRFFDLSVAGNGDKGDTVSVVVTATRGIDVGTATNFVRVFNSAPFAFSQTGAAQAGVPTEFTLRGADFDGETLTYKRVGGPKNGTATLVNNADGTATLTYTALSSFGGVEVIRFVALDEFGRPSTPATLSINVTAQAPPVPPNRAPSANNVTASTRSGVEVAIPLSGSDPDGDPITFKRVGGPVNGTGEIRLDSDGVYKMFYLPRANFVGNEVIRFVVLDDKGKPSAVATMTINVSGAPSALRSAPDAPSGGSS